MPTLNLKANNEPQQKIKEYLEQSASDNLADKINFGAEIEKDGKTLVNKKTLDGFMRYATEEARKMAEKGSNCACIDSDTVFGWAIHYFEEDAILEKLYNEDGTEYQAKKSAPKKTEKKTEPKKAEPKPEVKKTETQTTITEVKTSSRAKSKVVKNQVSLFDLYGAENQVSLFDLE